MFTNTSPQAAQSQPSHIRHQNPGLEVDLAIQINPYFLGNQYMPEDDPQRPGIPSYLFPGFSPYQAMKAPALQRNEKADRRTRSSGKLNSNISPGMALTLSVRIEDVNQIWGYAEDKSTVKPMWNTSQSHNVGNQNTTGNENSPQVGAPSVFNQHKYNETINPVNPTSVNTGHDYLDDFLSHDPGQPNIVETGNENPSQVASPTGYNTHPFDKNNNPAKPPSLNHNTDVDYAEIWAVSNSDPGKPNILSTGNGNSAGISGSYDNLSGSNSKPFLYYGPSEFEDFLNHKHNKNNEDIFNSGPHESTVNSSPTELDKKDISSYGLKEFDDFLKQKMEESKREIYATDTGINHVEGQKPRGTNEKSSVSSQSKPEDKPFSDYGIKEYNDFLNKRMEESKRQKYVTDNHNLQQHGTGENPNISTHYSNQNIRRPDHTPAYDIDERLAFSD